MIRKILLPALAAVVLLSAACGDGSPADSDPPVDLEATVDAQVTARLYWNTRYSLVLFY